MKRKTKQKGEPKDKKNEDDIVVSMFYFKQDVDFNHYILLCINKNVDIKFTAHDAFLE
jgi:hypothetical protein